MSLPIVSRSSPVALIGGAPVESNDLDLVSQIAPTLVALDGGAARACELGRIPDAIIGDMDSLPPDMAAEFGGRIHRIREQETTDFDKALRNVDAPLTLAVGVTGGRLDHELAVFHTLLRHPHRRCVVVGVESLVLLCPPRLTLELTPGALVSLFPMAPCTVASQGLRWPTDGLNFSPLDRIGTSNEATGTVTLAPDSPHMLLLICKTTLNVVCDALLNQGEESAVWPPE